MPELGFDAGDAIVHIDDCGGEGVEFDVQFDVRKDSEQYGECR